MKFNNYDGFLKKVNGYARVSSNIFRVTDSRYLNIYGGQMKTCFNLNFSSVTNVGDPIEDGDVVTKNYLQNILSGKDGLEGGSGKASTISLAFFGLLIGSNLQTGLEELEQNSLKVTGGVMNGDLDMGSNIIKSRALPKKPEDLCNKSYCDSVVAGLSKLSDVANSIDFAGNVNRRGDTMTGPLTMGSNAISTLALPISESDLCNKLYTDFSVAKFVSKAGGALMGNLSVLGGVTAEALPNMSEDLCNKEYVDSLVDSKIDFTGCVMTGDLDMWDNNVTASFNPIFDEDLCNKKYVDSLPIYDVFKVGSFTIPARLGQTTVEFIEGPGIKLVPNTVLKKITIAFNSDTVMQAAINKAGFVSLNDTLESFSKTKALTANQGRNLASKIASLPTALKCVGTYNAISATIESLSSVAMLKGVYVIGQDLPGSNTVLNNDFFIVSVEGTLSSNLQSVTVCRGDWIVSLGDSWEVFNFSRQNYVASQIVFNETQSSKIRGGDLQVALDYMTNNIIADPILKNKNQVLQYNGTNWIAADYPKVLKGPFCLNFNGLVNALELYNIHDKATYMKFSSTGTSVYDVLLLGRIKDGSKDIEVKAPAGNLVLQAQEEKKIFLKIGSSDILSIGSTIVSNVDVNLGAYKATSTVIPQDSKDLCNKAYLDNVILPLSVAKGGDTMVGNLDLGGNKAKSSAFPINHDDICNKAYVDSNFVGMEGKLSKAGGTMTGNLNMGTNKIKSKAIPAAPEDLCNKAYIDNFIYVLGNSGASLNLKVSKTGDTMTGKLIFSSGIIKSEAIPVNPEDMCNKAYVDLNADTINRVVSRAGDTLSGSIDMGNNKVTSSYVPVNPQDLCNKAYVDQTFTLAVSDSGDRMTGDLNMGGNKITSSYVPVNPEDLCNKGYIDTTVSKILTQSGNVLTRLSKAGDTMTGNLNMGSNQIKTSFTPVNVSDLCNKAYVDVADNSYLKKSGGTMTGDIDMGADRVILESDPIDPQDFSNKHYIDSKVSLLNSSFSSVENVSIFGDTMNGSLQMGRNKVTSLTRPIDSNDVCNKIYVDDVVNSMLPISGGVVGGEIIVEMYKVKSKAVPTLDPDICNKAYLTSVVQGFLLQSGGRMQGNLDMGLNKIGSTWVPVDSCDLCNKLYVDTASSSLSNSLQVSGGRMTGPLQMGSNKIISTASVIKDIDACNKAYVDKAVLGINVNVLFNNKLNKAGDTMTAALDMNENRILSTYTPINAEDLCNKAYVDNTIASKFNALGFYVDSFTSYVADNTWYGLVCWLGSSEFKIVISARDSTGNLSVCCIEAVANNGFINHIINYLGDFSFLTKIGIKNPANASDDYKMYMLIDKSCNIKVEITAKPTVVGSTTSYAKLIKDVDNVALLSTDPGNTIVCVINKVSYNGLPLSTGVTLSKSGGSMTGSLNMGNNKVTSSSRPTTFDVICNKQYVDNLFSGSVKDNGYLLQYNGSTVVFAAVNQITIPVKSTLAPYYCKTADISPYSGTSANVFYNAIVGNSGTSDLQGSTNLLLFNTDTPLIQLYQDSYSARVMDVSRAATVLFDNDSWVVVTSAYFQQTVQAKRTANIVFLKGRLMGLESVSAKASATNLYSQLYPQKEPGMVLLQLSTAHTPNRDLLFTAFCDAGFVVIKVTKEGYICLINVNNVVYKDDYIVWVNFFDVKYTRIYDYSAAS